MREIDNLVFKGGGVLGTAYAGAIAALDEHKLLENIKGVAGTSSGSITAALVSLRYSSEEITQITHALHFQDFKDWWNPFRIITSYGLYKGDAFLAWMKKIIKDKTGNENITFSELIHQGYRDLKVYATDLNAATIKEFSNHTTPDVVVAESLRASMSVPFLFSAWKFPSGIPDNHIYIDGGAVYNFPITAFDLKKTMGFFLYHDQADVVNLGYNELFLYTRLLYKSINAAQDVDFGKDKEEEAITVRIDDFGISTMDLNITDAQKTVLFNSGKKATVDYLRR